MERKTTPIDASHDAQEWTMQGTGERDKQMRVYPWPLPSTHRFEYEWDPTTMKRTDRVVAKTEDELFMEAAGKAALAARDGRVPLAVMQNLGGGKYEVGPHLPTEAKPIVTGNLAAELNALSDADLETRAAMEGVAVKDAKGKKLTKAVVIASILEKKK